MKLLLLSATKPFFAQALAGGSDFIGAIIILAIMIGLFFLFRGILLWYWKVDDIVKNQEETNRLLKSIVRNLESKNDHGKQNAEQPL